MNKNRLFKTAFLVVFLVGCFAISSVAQTVVGKVDGYVRDKNTNEPLLGAQVIIEGTDPLRGAASNEEGYFFILNVKPGTYTITASFLGYTTQKQTEVIVKPDVTAILNFMMSEEALGLEEEIIVSAERSMLQDDRTSKVNVLTHDQILELPVNDLTRLLATQSNIQVLTATPYQKAGYEQRGYDDIRMRGGRNNEISLMIDGMQVNNPVFGGFGTRLNTFSIDQMSIQAGGFDASYGNALSGVVNITTREGGNRTSGQLQYNTARPFGIDALATESGEAQNNHDLDFSLNGPVPRVSGLTYFIGAGINLRASASYFFDDITWDDHRGDLPTSLELMNQYAQDGSLVVNGILVDDDVARTVTTPIFAYGFSNRWINPLDVFTGWHGFGWLNGADINGKLTYRLTNDIKVNVNLRHSQTYRQPMLRNARTYYRWPTGQYMWYADNDLPNLVDEDGSVTGTVGQQYLARYPDLPYDQYAKTQIPNEVILRNQFYNESGMAGNNISFQNSQTYSITLSHNLTDKTFYTFRAQRFHTDNRSRMLINYEEPFKNDWWKFGPDWSNVKTKWEYRFSTFNAYDPWEGYFYLSNDQQHYSGDQSFRWSTSLDFTSQITKNHQLKTGVDMVYIDLAREDYQSSGGVTSRPTIYRYFPKEGAIYFTDKIDYQSLILSIGGRVDFANAGGSMWSDPLDPLGTQDPFVEGIEYNGFVTAKKKFRFAPRFGLAFPITDVSQVHFNFGHFYQNPNYRDLYRATNDLEVAMMGNNIIGNPSLTPEKSIQYEIGIQHQLTQIMAINVDLWLKETTNQVGSVRVPAYSDDGNDNPFQYSVFINNNFGAAKGVDVRLQKRYSHYFSGTLDYSWSQSSVLKQTSWDGYWDGNTTQTAPRREERAEWERPHSIRGNIDFNLPPGFGPTVLGIKPLSSFGFNLIYFGTSGWSYTPSSTSASGLGEFSETRSSTTPFTHRIDGRFRKLFKLFDLDTQAFVTVRNLLNNRNTEDPFNSTGRAGDYTSGGQYSITYNDGHVTNNFSEGRSVAFGFRISW